MSKKEKVIYDITPWTRWTPEQAIRQVPIDEMNSLIVVGFDDEGDLRLWSSEMTREQANWILDLAKYHALHERVTEDD